MDIKIQDLKNTVRLMREFKGLTQKQLSQETKLTQSIISYVEISDGSSTIETIRKIFDALGYELRLKLVPKKDTKQENQNQSLPLQND